MHVEISRKYYVELKKVSKVPIIEKIRFEGRIYSTVGLMFLRKKILQKEYIICLLGCLNGLLGMTGFVNL